MAGGEVREEGRAFLLKNGQKKLARLGNPGMSPNMLLEGTVNKPQAYGGILQTGN